MLKLSTIIFQGLTGASALVAIFGDRVFPLLADQKTPVNYITYSVRFLNSGSKDGVGVYEVRIENYHKTYNEACEGSDLIKAAMKALLQGTPENIYKFSEGTKEPYITEDEKEHYIEQKFNITI